MCSCLKSGTKKQDELRELKENQSAVEGDIRELRSTTERLKQGITKDEKEILSLSYKQSKTESTLSELERKTFDIERELGQGLTSTNDTLKDLQIRQNRGHEAFTELIQKQLETQNVVSDLKDDQATIERSIVEIEHKQNRADEIVDAMQHRQLAADGSISDVREKQKHTHTIVDELRKSHAALEHMSYEHGHNQTRLDEMLYEFVQKQSTRKQETDRIAIELVDRIEAQERKHNEIELNLKQTQTITDLLAEQQREMQQKIAEDARAISLSEESRYGLESAIQDLTRKHRLLEALVYDQKQVVDNMQQLLLRKDEVISGLHRDLYSAEDRKKELDQMIRELKDSQKKTDKLVEGFKRKETEKQESVEKLLLFLQNEPPQRPPTSSDSPQMSAEADKGICKESTETNAIVLFQSVSNLLGNKGQGQEDNVPVSINDITLEEKKESSSKNQNAEEENNLLHEINEKILQEIKQKLDIDKGSLGKELDATAIQPSSPQEERTIGDGNLANNANSKIPVSTHDERKETKDDGVELELKTSDTDSSVDAQEAPETVNIDAGFAMKHLV